MLRVQLISFQVLFQCKRWKGSVGSEVIRNFRGAMQGRADKGLIITTGTFSAEARKEATRDGAPAIDLIDGEALCGLMRESGLGVRVRAVWTEEVTRTRSFSEDLRARLLARLPRLVWPGVRGILPLEARPW